MITFDNTRVNTENYTLDLFDAAKFLFNVVMVPVITGSQASFIASVPGFSFASTSDYVTYTGSGTGMVGQVHGATVVTAWLESDSGMWVGVDGRKIGVTVGSSSLTFSDQSEDKLVLPASPDFDEPFRFVYTVETDSDMDLVFHAISLYNGDALLGSCVFSAEQAVRLHRDDADGLFISSLASKTFKLERNTVNRPVSYLTVDVSEAPQESLARVMSSFPVTYRGRYDGSVFIRSQAGDEDPSVIAIDDYYDLAVGKVNRTTHQGVYTRARVSGALPESERVDLDYADKYLLKFRVFQNPEIMSEGDAYTEAKRIMRNNRRYTHPMLLNWHTLPILETGDVVTINGTRYIFGSASYDIGIRLFGTVMLVEEQ